MGRDLKDVETHFAFGANWASYADRIDDSRIAGAVGALQRLAGGDLRGKTFLDIGSGSGLHSLAALRLGAARVLALDVDPQSVATTRAVLERFAPGAAWAVEPLSVFELEARTATIGRFDVVYSWGVLHHTGDLNRALRIAALLVADGGMFLVALYRRTRLCGFWAVEKRWYSKAAPWAQRLTQRAYGAWHDLLSAVSRLRRGGAERTTVEPRRRGMALTHDVHDWLGGFPYESILPDDVARILAEYAFEERAAFLVAPTRGRIAGWLGSGCDEYRFVRRGSA
jgi:SAM-dependent methyltransferase